VRISLVPDTRCDEWNALATRENSFSLLQSWEWGHFKEKLGWKAVRVAAEEDGRIFAGAQLLIRPIPSRAMSVAYLPRGPIGAWLHEPVVGALIDELSRVARRHRAVFLRVEPALPDDSETTMVLQALGFRESPASNQPRATMLVDLTPDPDEILARMHRKTRYNIRYATRKGVTIRTGDVPDLELVYRLLRATARRGGFSARSRRYYREEFETFAGADRLRLLVASYEGEPLAVNVSAVFGSHAAYIHGASADRHRELMPNHLLMWEAMRWAKDRGCRSFDLWGIPDEVGRLASQHQPLPAVETTNGLWGVFRFKRGFGGEIAYYTGAHDLVYTKSIYGLVHRAMIARSASEQSGTRGDQPVPAVG